MRRVRNEDYIVDLLADREEHSKHEWTLGIDAGLWDECSLQILACGIYIMILKLMLERKRATMVNWLRIKLILHELMYLA